MPELPKNTAAPRGVGDTNREPMESTAQRATKAATDETINTGGTGAARGAQAKSQPR